MLCRDWPLPQDFNAPVRTRDDARRRPVACAAVKYGRYTGPKHCPHCSRLCERGLTVVVGARNGKRSRGAEDLECHRMIRAAKTDGGLVSTEIERGSPAPRRADHDDRERTRPAAGRHRERIRRERTHEIHSRGEVRHEHGQGQRIRALLQGEQRGRRAPNVREHRQPVDRVGRNANDTAPA